LEISPAKAVCFCLKRISNVEEARRIAQETETMLAFGGFSIKHWIISGTETGYKGIVNTNMKLAEFDSLTALYILEISPAKAVCFCLKRISTAIKAFIIFDPFAQ
jgi:hypothetical protein